MTTELRLASHRRALGFAKTKEHREKIVLCIAALKIELGRVLNAEEKMLYYK